MPYRDEQASLESRREELRGELAEATRKAETLAAAVRDQETLTRELASIEARLRRLSSRNLPLLDGVRIASPCTASWEAMTGDDRVRFCGSCEKNVYNLSALASEEAERLLAQHEGSICVRLYRRADGTVLTADCPVGVRRKRVKRAVVAVAGAGALAAAAAASFFEQGKPAREMGEVSVVGGETPMMGAPSTPVMGSAAPVRGDVGFMGMPVIPPEPAVRRPGQPSSVPAPPAKR